MAPGLFHNPWKHPFLPPSLFFMLGENGMGVPENYTKYCYRQMAEFFKLAADKSVFLIVNFPRLFKWFPTLLGTLVDPDLARCEYLCRLCFRI